MPAHELQLTYGRRVNPIQHYQIPRPHGNQPEVKQKEGTYPLGLDPGADIFAKYALRKAGITRNVLIDKEGRIVKLTRLYNPEEFASLVKEIDGMLSE